MKAQDVYKANARKIYAAYRFILIVLGLLFVFFFLGIFFFSDGALFMIITSSIVGLVLLGFLFVQYQQLRRLETFLKRCFKKDEGEFRQLGSLFLSENGWLYWDNKKGKDGTFDQIRQCSIIEGEGKSITGGQYPVYKLTLTTVKEEALEVIVKDRTKAEQVVSYLFMNNPALVKDQNINITEISFKDLPNQK